MNIDLKQANAADIIKAFARRDVTLVTFPEPSSTRPFPVMPTQPVEKFQFWLVKQEWEKEWEHTSGEISTHFGAAAKHVLAHTRSLLEVFTRVTSDPAPFVSLRAVDKDYLKQSAASVSAGWHRDASVLTLQHTFSGESLQWTPDDNVRRDYFDNKQIQTHADRDSDVLIDPERYHVVPSGTVAILKGELRSDESDPGTLDFLGNFIDATAIPDFNRKNGLIHRGDKTTELGRIVLTISTHKIPDWMPR